MSSTADPANPFLERYTRSPEMTAALVKALSRALYANPTLRLGQLLDNVSHGDKDMLREFYDETWIHWLGDTVGGWTPLRLIRTH